MLPNPFGVTKRAIFTQQSIPDQLLHGARAGEAERLCKTNDTGRLDIAAFGNHRERLEGEVIGLVQNVAGDPLQPIAKAVIAFTDRV